MSRGGRAAPLAALLLTLLAGCETPEGAAPGDGAAAEAAPPAQAAAAVTEPGPPETPERRKDEAPAEIEAGTGLLAQAAPPEAAATQGDLRLEPLLPRREISRPEPEADRALAETRRRLGLALEAAGDIEAATSEFEAALAAPWPAETAETPWSDLARICRRTEPAAAVVRACGRVLNVTRFPPDDLAEFLANRGDAHVRLDRPEAALADYRAALEIDSTNFRALLGLARLKIEAGNPAAALNDLRLALTIGRRQAEARLVRGRAWMALDDPERAVAEYEAVLADPAARPYHPAALRGRAEARCAMGLAVPAVEDWRLWAESVPDGAARLQDMLRARDYLRGPAHQRLGPATLAALKAWTAAGCP